MVPLIGAVKNFPVFPAVSNVLGTTLKGETALFIISPILVPPDWYSNHGAEANPAVVVFTPCFNKFAGIVGLILNADAIPPALVPTGD